jgi:hypothetical protein
MNATAVPSPTLEQVLQQMHAQQIQIMQRLDKMEQRGSESASPPATQAAQPTHAAAQAHHRAAQPRIPPPATCAGEADKLDEWFAEIDQQIAWYQFASDAEALRWATTYLRGAARDWWQTLAQKPTDYVSFGTALRKRFQPVTTAETARAKMRKLTQGSSHINTYVAQFRRLTLAVPDMSEADKLFNFLTGVRPSIAAQIRMLGVATLNDAIVSATRIGSAGEIHMLASSNHSSAQGSEAAMDISNIEGLEQETSAEGAASSTAPAGAGVPVTREDLRELLNAMREERKAPAARSQGGKQRQRGLPVVPHLSPDQVRQYMDAGKCFGCGSTEHRSRECPKRKVDGGGRVGWSK